MATGTTAIRAPTDDLKNHTIILRQLKEIAEVGQRLRGDPTDSFVKVSDLVGAGLARFVNNQIQPLLGEAGGAGGTVSVVDSITGDGSSGSPLQLSGDTASPGNNKLYGTGSSGTKGWFSQPSGGSITVTDGAHTVAGATTVTFSGAVVGGTSPNATVAVGSSAPLSTVLLHFDGTNGQTSTVDSSANAFAVTRIGSAVLSNTQHKFGATSGTISATDGWSISLANFQLGDAYCYTIDFWIYLTSLPGTDNAILGQWNNSGPGGAAQFTWLTSYHTSNHLTFYQNNTFPIWNGGTISLNTWHHVAIVRVGALAYCFLDGVIYGSPLTPLALVTSASNLQVGGMGGAASGFVDELRIVKGTNVYNANFTPPTSAYTQ